MSASWGEPLLEFMAFGDPAPQGSKRHVGGGRLVESSKKVAPWRSAVRASAIKAMATRAVQAYDGALRPTKTMLDGPVMAEFCFSMHRPASAPKKRIFPDRMPDLSKLIRSTEDAMTDAGVWTDDARVVRYHNPRKVYVGSDDPDALPMPGVLVRVWAWGGDA